MMMTTHAYSQPHFNSAFHVSPEPGNCELRVRAEMLRIAFGDQPFGLIASLTIALAFAWVLSGSLETIGLSLWFAGVVVIVGGRLFLAAAYHRNGARRPLEDPASVFRWEMRFVVAAAIMGAWWGAGAWLAHPAVPASQRGLVVLVVGGMVMCTSRSLAPVLSAFYVFAGAAIAPLSVRLFLDGAASAAFAAMCALVFLGFLMIVARSYHSTIARSLRLSFENADLVDALRSDIQARVTVEHEKAHLEKQFQETQKLESLGVLAGGIAHDFNNLLTVILGNVDLARPSLPPDSAMREYVGNIVCACHQGAALCRQMLAYAGKSPIVLEAVNLTNLVEDTTRLLEVTVAHRARIVYRLDPKLPLVQADPSQIRQIVMNLVLNGAEAVEEGRGHIVVTTGRMRMDGAYLSALRVNGGLPEGEGVYLEVRDNGAGMTSETLARIFEPFFTTKVTGRGLGLAAVLGIVRNHHGALHVASEPKRGSTFRFLLAPCAAGETAAGSEAPANVEDVVIRPGDRALVVDDDDAVRLVASRVLEQLGFEVESAADGDDALALLSDDPGRFRFILLDTTMPRRHGMATLQSIREINPSAMVVMMSGYSEHDARSRMGSDDPVPFLPKPFDIESLERCVANVLAWQLQPVVPGAHGDRCMNFGLSGSSFPSQ